MNEDIKFYYVLRPLWSSQFEVRDQNNNMLTSIAGPTLYEAWEQAVAIYAPNPVIPVPSL